MPLCVIIIPKYVISFGIYVFIIIKYARVNETKLVF